MTEVLINPYKPDMTLRTRIKAYNRRMQEIKSFLDENPNEWGLFQSEFNQEVNGVFRDLMIFEKEHFAKGEEDKVYKLKNFFIEWFRKDFVVGDYTRRSLEKPYGYAGDFQVIDDIYLNNPQTTGFERLFDNYFQMSTICHAVRNRKEDFKRVILKYVAAHPRDQVCAMDLASGPCRDVFEVLQKLGPGYSNMAFHCYDADENSSKYATQLLGNDPRVTFIKENAVRLALKKNLEELIPERYDIIFSTGLFDYLDYKISVRLITNLKKLLKPGGIIAISDVRDKFSNPSIYFMEWVADWNLVYRDDGTFRQIFIDSGFTRDELTYLYEQQGVLQYILGTKSK